MLDLSSLKRIVGETKEVIVYGFLNCYYQAITRELNDLHFNTNPTTLFQLTKYDSGIDQTSSFFQPKRIYKNILTSLMLENYRRVQNNQPLIPLIFCVASEDEENQKDLDVERVAKSHSDTEPLASITDSELRRCYKLYAETSSELKKIVEKSFKFVKVKKQGECYQLEELLPFWQTSSWKSLWQTRKEHTQTKPAFIKKYPWRSVLEHHTGLFFNHPSKEEDAPSLPPFYKLR